LAKRKFNHGDTEKEDSARGTQWVRRGRGRILRAKRAGFLPAASGKTAR
jgi:hypothetical protein